MIYYKRKFDTWPVGIVSGIFAPIVGVIVFWQLNLRYMTFGGFINYISSVGYQSKLMSLCVIANLPLFFLFLRFDMYKSTKGILMMTILWAILNYSMVLFFE